MQLSLCSQVQTLTIVLATVLLSSSRRRQSELERDAIAAETWSAGQC